MSIDDVTDFKLKSIYGLASGNTQDIHHIRMELQRLRDDEEGEIEEEADLEPLRTFINEEGALIPGVDDNLDYFLEKGNINPEDVERINSIKEENRELRRENNDLRRRLLELIAPNDPEY